jgi:hypothetical protein
MAISFRWFRHPLPVLRSPGPQSLPGVSTDHGRSNVPPSEPRNTVMAHALTSSQTPRRREKKGTLRPEGPRVLAGSPIAISALLYAPASRPTPVPSSDDVSSSRATIHHDQRQGTHHRRSPWIMSTIAHRDPGSRKFAQPPLAACFGPSHVRALVTESLFSGHYNGGFGLLEPHPFQVRVANG